MAGPQMAEALSEGLGMSEYAELVKDVRLSRPTAMEQELADAVEALEADRDLWKSRVENRPDCFYRVVEVNSPALEAENKQMRHLLRAFIDYANAPHHSIYPFWDAVEAARHVLAKGPS